MPSGSYIVCMALQASPLSFSIRTQTKKGGSEVTEDWFTGRNHAYPEKLPATTLP